MKDILNFIIETAKVVVIALLIVIPIRFFLFQPFIVSGQSMEPNLAHGDYLIVDQISFRFREPERGEIVVFRYPENPSFRHIKRIIGLPGETIITRGEGIAIKDYKGELISLNESSYLNLDRVYGDVEILLAEDEYFVMGDNRPVSFDSRRWGPLSRENIIGRFAIRLLPINRFQKAEIPNY